MTKEKDYPMIKAIQLLYGDKHIDYIQAFVEMTLDLEEQNCDGSYDYFWEQTLIEIEELNLKLN